MRPYPYSLYIGVPPPLPRAAAQPFCHLQTIILINCIYSFYPRTHESISFEQLTAALGVTSPQVQLIELTFLLFCSLCYNNVLFVFIPRVL